MKKGLRKLLLGLAGIGVLCAVAITTRDASVVYGTGSMISTLVLGLVWGYRGEYNNEDK
jgi:hypothetical protein